MCYSIFVLNGTQPDGPTQGTHRHTVGQLSQLSAFFFYFPAGATTGAKTAVVQTILLNQNHSILIVTQIQLLFDA